MKTTLLLKNLQTGETYTAGFPAIIGRGNRADIRITDKGVSRIHARIEAGTDGLRIIDLGSANGTFVNDEKILNSKTLRLDDIITLGTTRLLVSPEEDEQGTETVILGSMPVDEKQAIDSERLHLIYQIAVNMAEYEDMDRLLQDFFASLSELIRFDRCFFVTIDETGNLSVRYPRNIQGLPFSRTVADKVLLSGQTLLLQDAMADRSFAMQESIMGMHIRSALCAPLRFRKRIFGFIYMDRGLVNAFSNEDMNLVSTTAFIMGPILENTRLRQEIEQRYQDTLLSLKKTEARLLNTERIAAFARLAQAVAHEIRNPVTVAGGLLRRLALKENKADIKMNLALEALGRVDNILKEVDSFVTQRPPEPVPAKAYDLLKACLVSMDKEFLTHSLKYHVEDAEDLLIFADETLFKKAICYLCREIIERPPREKTFLVSVKRHGNLIEILFGKADQETRFGEPFDQEILHRPWRFGLFLNMAYKVIADHEGRMLINTEGNSVIPVKILLPARPSPV